MHYYYVMKLIENLETTNQMWFEKKESLTESPSQPSLQAQGEQGQRTGCFQWTWNTVQDYRQQSLTKWIFEII